MKKKTYIVPEALVIKLTLRSMIAFSMNHVDGEIDKEEDVLVKEQTGGSWNTGSKSIWDKEW